MVPLAALAVTEIEVTAVAGRPTVQSLRRSPVPSGTRAVSWFADASTIGAGPR